MDKFFGSKYFKWGFTAFCVVVAATLFYFIVGNIGSIFGGLGALISILSSLIIGLVIAYILNPVVAFFEKKFFKKIKSTTKRRNLAIAATLICAFAIIVAIFSIVIPQVLQSIISLINNSDNYVSQVGDLIKKFMDDGNNAARYDKWVESVVNALKVNVLPAAEATLANITSGIAGVVTGLINMVIGIVFAVYILANTRNFGAGLRKTMYAFFDVEKVNNFVDNVKHVNTVFLRFMVGKITDSSIVCLCTLLFLLVCRFPYALLIAIIIGITDLIPYFGPYIGTIPSALLLAVVDPIKAIIFIAFIICMQQIDANLITPRIQSNATGLPSFWVLFAITLFGGLFGVVGLLIGVPCFTIIYEIVTDFINSKLKKKNLPVSTEYYEKHSEVEPKKIQG